jgi:AcrR family transcriptional regulator
MARSYRMKKRAEARDQTRERIIHATMQLHDEKGIAPTTFSEVAERAGVGVATVFRHFPKLGDLVRACGAHVWQEMRPPVPDGAAAVFAGLDTTPERMRRLVEEIDAFYARGALRLALAARDRDLLPELDQFLSAVEAGIDAMVREALKEAKLSPRAIEVALALMSFPVWAALDRLGLTAAERIRMRTDLLECGIRSASSA